MSDEKEQSKGLIYKEENKDTDQELEEIIKDLPKEKHLREGLHFYKYQGFWIKDIFLKGVISAQRNFLACEDDILLTSCPKSGTTWLISLMFSIMSRSRNDAFSLAHSPLIEQFPHDLVPFLENYVSLGIPYSQHPNSTENVPLTNKRLISTHMPYSLLPPSVVTSDCKIVYVYRNPVDQFISYWHFCAVYRGGKGDLTPIENSFDRYCRGIHGFGPFWDHALEFWKASLERPRNILFLKYEDLKKYPHVNVKMLAEFIGFSFSEEDEKNGVIEKILNFCSFEKLKNLDINKNGTRSYGGSNSMFFRKGEVGDSRNFLTSAMIERMVNLMKEKYGEHYSNFELPV